MAFTAVFGKAIRDSGWIYQLEIAARLRMRLMGVLGESSVILIPAVDQPFGSMAHDFAIGSFRESPPERIGVKGEYDYNGLAKRVRHSFEQAFGDQVQLSIGQRGCVVTLTGVVASRSLLNRLVSLAIKVEGAALVEIYSVRFTEDEVAAARVAV